MTENNGANGIPTNPAPVQGVAVPVPGQVPYQQYPQQSQAYQQPPMQGYSQPQPYQQLPMQGYPQPQPYQQPQPAMQGYAQPQPQTADQAQTRKVIQILYGVITLGLLLMAGLGVFLPWSNMQVLYQDTTYHASMNGLGQFSGDPLFVTALQQNASVAIKDGVFELFLAFFIALFIIGGFLTRSGWFAIGILVCATLCTYMFGVDLADANNKLANATSDTASSTLGIGMPLGLAGSLVILVAAIAAAVYSSRLKKSKTAFRQ